MKQLFLRTLSSLSIFLSLCYLTLLAIVDVAVVAILSSPVLGKPFIHKDGCRQRTLRGRNNVLACLLRAPVLRV